jgi:hypothetical protein
MILKHNMEEALAMLIEDGEPAVRGAFVGTQMIQVG